MRTLLLLADFIRTRAYKPICEKLLTLPQEELAVRLNIVRQTVSKWEKGLSVPDADLLVKLADILEVSVAELLGGNIPDCEDTNELAEQLSRINEQLAIKNRRSRRIWKVVLGIIVAFVVINIFFVIVGVISNNSYREYTNVEQLPISEENQTYENNP